MGNACARRWGYDVRDSHGDSHGGCLSHSVKEAVSIAINFPPHESLLIYVSSCNPPPVTIGTRSQQALQQSQLCNVHLVLLVPFAPPCSSLSWSPPPSSQPHPALGSSAELVAQRRKRQRKHGLLRIACVPYTQTFRYTKTSDTHKCTSTHGHEASCEPAVHWATFLLGERSPSSGSGFGLFK